MCLTMQEKLNVCLSDSDSKVVKKIGPVYERSDVSKATALHCVKDQSSRGESARGFSKNVPVKNIY